MKWMQVAMFLSKARYKVRLLKREQHLRANKLLALFHRCGRRGVFWIGTLIVCVSIAFIFIVTRQYSFFSHLRFLLFVLVVFIVFLVLVLGAAFFFQLLNRRFFVVALFGLRFLADFFVASPKKLRNCCHV